jgi:AcrR family transcriptional regulator
MQVLKDDIRLNILNTASRLFYNKGFEKTTTRRIALEVNMSVSNLYKYFRNKEDIFDAIVKAYHDNYLKNFSEYISHEDEDDFGTESKNKLALAIFESIKGNQTRFVILMDKSAGTRYASFKNVIMDMLENHIRRDISDDYKDEYIVKLFVRNFFYGIVEIAKNYEDDSWAFKNINLLVQYHMSGVSILYK